MHSTAQGIELGERETLAMLGFCGDTAALAQVLFKVTKKNVIACAANGRAAVEYTGKNEGHETGEFPVSKSFLELCAAAAVEGSKHVPAQIVRLLLDRSAIGGAVVVMKESGKEGTTLTNPDRIEPSAQLKFKEVHDLVDFDPDRPGHWFAVQGKHAKPVYAIEAAAEKCPITWVPARDELSPVGFIAKCDYGEWKGILRPVEVAGPGKAATHPEPDDDDDNEDERQPSLPGTDDAKANGKDEDDGVISDEEARALKAKANGAKEPELATAKKKRRVKNRRQATS